MDPISALIGGMFSIGGGLLNQSSQQAINTANIQQQQWAAQGGYLPGLVANANKAGISPLAVLGQHAPTVGTAISGSPGAGLAGAGEAISHIDPHFRRMADVEYEKARVDVANARQLGNNAAIEGARNSWLLDQMEAWKATHPTWAPEGLQQPTVGGAGVDWLNHFFNAPWNDPRSTPLSQITRRWPSSVLGSPLQ